MRYVPGPCLRLVLSSLLPARRLFSLGLVSTTAQAAAMSVSVGTGDTRLEAEIWTTC